jgi:hypothetical protein
VGNLSNIELIVLVLVTFLAVSLLFNIATLLDNNKKSKERQMRKLRTERILQQPLTNRRRSIRINFMEENKSCYVKVVKLGNEVVKGKVEGEARLVDVSGTGMRFLFDKDLPVRKGVTVSLRFELEDEKFNVDGEIMRKTETLKDSIAYGVDFRDISTADENRLIRIIMSISRDKRRALINKNRTEVKRTATR